MTSAEKEYIKHCIHHAKESYTDVQLLAKNKRWNACANRLYYTCFHIVSGLLYRNNIKVKTHKGLDVQFKLHFVKTGKVSKQHSDLFTDLMRLRQESDYSDMFDCNEKMVKPFIQQVKRFLSDIEKLIK